MARRPEEATGSFGPGVTRGYELPCGFWELNQVFRTASVLTVGPSRQRPSHSVVIVVGLVRF